MRSRSRAILVAAGTAGIAPLAWVGAAVVALVTLRHGVTEGMQVVIWAVLPAALIASYGEFGPLAMLLSAIPVAYSLRQSHHWATTLAVISLCGVLTGAALLSIGSDYLLTLQALLEEVLKQTTTAEPSAVLAPPSVEALAGWLAMTNALSVLGVLLLARWWQAQLYNPGGFRNEFHRLRLPPGLTVLLLGIALLLWQWGDAAMGWLGLPLLPIIVAGFSLLHAQLARRGLDSKWLILAYLSWLLLDPVKLLLLLLAIADSWMNFRRLQSTSTE